MERIATVSPAARADLFQETAARRGMNPAVIEKDFWVCWALRRLFSSQDLASKFLFKGGTTLSKIFRLIDRFSEDVDLVLKLEDVTERDLVDGRSRKKQKEFLEQIRADATSYIRDAVFPVLVDLTKDLCTVTRGDETEPRVLYLEYPPAFRERYVLPRIKLEIGPVALWTPNAEYTMLPYAAEEFPGQFADATCRVLAVNAERTFWEKATILHAQAHLPDDKTLQARYSRHYYDLAQMAGTEIGRRAVGDLELLSTVVEFKEKCFHSGWASYATARPGSFRLLPGLRVERELRRDYGEMQVMIYGNSPTFDEILGKLETLERVINEVDAGKLEPRRRI